MIIPTLYKRKDVQALLGISESTLWREIRLGRIIPTYVGRRNVRFTEQDVKNYIDLLNPKKLL